MEVQYALKERTVCARIIVQHEYTWTYDEMHFLCRNVLQPGPRTHRQTSPDLSNTYAISVVNRLNGRIGGCEISRRVWRTRPSKGCDDATAGLITMSVDMSPALPSSPNMKRENNSKRCAKADTHLAQCIQRRPVLQFVHNRRHHRSSWGHCPDAGP